MLELRAVTKAFGSTLALRAVDFDVRAGEVHALAGENGAGKSTLMKILAGVYTDYTGSLLLDQRPVRFRGPREARAFGIATIHQELSLVGSMSVADNFLFGRSGSALRPVSARASRADAVRALAMVGLELNPERRVESLPMGVRQLVEIARALALEARVLVMDEPTSALSESEAESLFSRIDALRARGTAIVYISHRMEEVYRLADRITVLRDGRRVASASPSALGPDALVHAMLGRSLEARAKTLSAAAGDTVLRVRDLSVAARGGSARLVLDRVSLDARRGEVLGIAGLRGAGASELLRALFGSQGRLDAGSVELDGQVFEPSSPRASVAAGVVLLSNDRATSVLGELSVLENATLSSLSRFCRGPWVMRSAERAAVITVAEHLTIATPSLDASARRLSGGNQQKVALARCLLTKPRLLLLDEPTRGIDVGAKADVYALIRELAGRGVSVLLVASETEELVALAERVIVLVRGRVVSELGGEALRREHIVSAAMGSPVEAS